MSQRIGSRSLTVRKPSALMVDALQRVGFWGSVLLPMVYLPLLYTRSGSDLLLALAIVVGLNLCCLVAGRHYKL